MLPINKPSPGSQTGRHGKRYPFPKLSLIFLRDLNKQRLPIKHNIAFLSKSTVKKPPLSENWAFKENISRHKNLLYTILDSQLKNSSLQVPSQSSQ
jgi:hypothetical protein